MRRDIRRVIEHLCDTENPLLNRIEREKLIEEVLDETLGFTKGPGATQPLTDAEVAERFPLVATLGPYNQPAHHEATFRLGLAAMLRDL